MIDRMKRGCSLSLSISLCSLAHELPKVDKINDGQCHVQDSRIAVVASLGNTCYVNGYANAAVPLISSRRDFVVVSTASRSSARNSM